MRVGMVCPYSLTIPGGVQMQVLALARELRRVGHVVQVLAPCDGAPPEPGVTSLGNSIPWATNGSVAPIAPDPSAAVRTIRALRSEQFDVVHVHEPLVPGPSLTAVLFCEQPTVGTFHRAGASRAYALFSPLTRRVGKRLAVRVAVSQDALTTARDGIRGEFTVLFNGIDVERFASATPAPTRGPTVLFFGRHEPRKGLGVLLEAAASLPDDVEFWIVGQGPQTDELKAKYAADDRLQWLGRLDDAELAQRLAGADVFCAPSLFGESFGVVLLEAMAAGTAIVASDLPGYRAVARPDEHALLVAPGDVDALAKTLHQLLTDPARRAELVVAGRSRAEEFAMPKLSAAYAEIYASLVKRDP
ncbi:MAG TPA: glycosyltransferase family 4 protein [Acidimicrobiales bacterium]|nr:glycosyltransferase family 4 protein [Acidimicrobiales bacterium]